MYGTPPRTLTSMEVRSQSPKSTTDYHTVELENSRQLLLASIGNEFKSITKESLHSKAHAKAEAAHCQRLGATARERTRSLQTPLQVAHARVIPAEDVVTGLQDEYEYNQGMLAVKTLNLKILRELLRDRDGRQLYSQDLLARQTAFGDFSETAKTRSDVAELQAELDTIQYMFKSSKVESRAGGDASHSQRASRKKLEAIRRYNRLNNILFDLQL